MEQEYTVRFEVRYEVKVRCKPEDLGDRVCDLYIPEDEQTRYVPDTFDLFDIQDEGGNYVDEKGEIIEGI